MGMKKGGPENTASMHLHCLAAPDLTNAARSSSTMIPLSLSPFEPLFLLVVLFYFGHVQKGSRPFNLTPLPNDKRHGPACTHSYL